MPSSAILHAACFAAGAVIGGGLVSAVSSKQRQTSSPPVPTVSAGKSSLVVPPIVDVGANGDARITSSAAVAALSSPVLKYGNPGPIADLLVRKAYVAGYDRRLRHPAWTAEHLTLASLGRTGPGDDSGDRSKSNFTEDPSLPTVFRATLGDYFRSGYDRGHMVPAADAKISQDAMDETFLLSNIAPQVGAGFNRHYWAYLEDWCRRLTNSFSDVYVFTIPLYLPKLEPDGKWRITHEVIGSPPNIGVPTHFAKVVLATKPTSPSTPDIQEVSTGAFVLPNAVISDEAPLTSFAMPVEAVERAAGLELFSEALKRSSKHICQTTKCELLVKRFDDAQKGKKPDMRRAVSAPR